MGEILETDVNALRALGQELKTTAGTIGDIRHTATVTMPGSPVAEAAEQCSVAAVTAYQFVGHTISEMADATKTAAATYEAVDQAFTDQLKGYLAGNDAG